MELFYFERNQKHIFELKHETFGQIMEEFLSIGNYLDSLGVSWEACGIKKDDQSIARFESKAENDALLAHFSKYKGGK